MEENLMYVLFILVPIIFFAYKIYQDKKNDLKQIKDSYGKKGNKDYSHEEYINIANGFYNQLNNRFSFMGKDENFDDYIDDITYNDLDLDEIYKDMDTTYSSLGQEELHRMLRFNNVSDKELAERTRLQALFKDNKDDVVALRYRFNEFGFSRKLSISDYIESFGQCTKKNIFSELIYLLLLIASIVYLVAFDVVQGMWALIIVSGFNIFNYYKQKASIDVYFMSLKQFYSMCMLAKKIKKLNIEGIKEYTDKYTELLEHFKPVRRFSFILFSGKLGIIDFFLDYIRMLTHLDLVKFYMTIDKLDNEKEKVYELYRSLGYIDAMIAVASYKETLDYYCEPEFDNKEGLYIDELYHPLITSPVANSINESKSVIITGSNASGKSTFLRSVGICALMAQAFNYCPARSYRASRFRIYSSMALTDNLLGNESYYMVEIKALKRIMDASVKEGNRILCFIDEVLRGTNTIERIAASSQILKKLSLNNTFCFAATHDIELTSILDKYYVNYHFEEKIEDDDITFEYRLKDGKATSRNAIKLLGLLGYSKDILDKANEEAANFENKGNWNSLL